MNLAFKEVFGEARPTLPLSDSGNIVCGNAAKIKWEEICPSNNGHEIYVLGNPPYLGQRNQKKQHQDDMDMVFGEIKKCRLGRGGRKRSLQPQPAWILPINTTNAARETFATKDVGVFCRQDGLVIGESGLIFVDCATYWQGKRMVTVVP